MGRSEHMKLIYRYNTGEDDWRYKCIDDYKRVDSPQRWKVCPNCGLIPKVWVFDNGRSTACGCGENEYNHFTVNAESICSHMKNSHNGQSMLDYDSDELRKNWNHWVTSEEELFVRGNRADGRW